MKKTNKLTLKLKLISIISQKINRKVGLLLCLSSLVATAPAFAGWEVNFIDKFEGTGVDWNNWTAQTDANFNNEVQCYTDDDSSENKNFDVSSGTLKIIARKQQVSCTGLNNQSRNWTSGRINGKDKREFLYGRIEARIRFHNLEGGTWPAFWMLENRIAESPRKNDNDVANWPNPGAGEIDVWEWFSNRPSSYITNFFNTGSGCGNELWFSYPNGANDVLAWHDYAIEWSENNISFYMDDTLVSSNNVSDCPQYKEPMFVLLNVAIGGALGGNIDPNLDQATMEVDYLAHCTATNQNNNTRCNEDTPTVYADDDNDGIANDIDECPNSAVGEVIDTNGCPNDDTNGCPNDPTVDCMHIDGDNDNDGVTDSIDECPNTPVGTTVDQVGCPVVDEDNIAPTVTLSIQQNNVAVSVIDINDGLVVITAVASDSNIGDMLSYSWIMGGAITSPEINDGSISFDPASMVLGSSHIINITVSDNGSPSLSTTDEIEFTVNGNQDSTPTITTEVESSSDSSGGSFNDLLLLLSFIYCRKYFNRLKR
ncbi:glycoside hydrolase family 16 protein [Colwellia echini]|uniref:Glycoside hydrolase family 16 protein n=1 Tax=Colwellia echini TaxID=1982103 RepID=A0ABY3MVF0_9GAMM|nr:glycoside hydrolase family 16 protein [Colwellia echini]TYK65111.1 glycoside hydrolase family 16 protein [Colwellia echini]